MKQKGEIFDQPVNFEPTEAQKEQALSEFFAQLRQEMRQERKIRNRFDKHPTLAEVAEVNTKPSQTVPDQSLSIKELVARYIRGEDIKIFPGIYAEEGEELFDIIGMSEMDLHDLARQTAEEIQELQDKLAKERSKPSKQELPTPPPAASEVPPTQ